MPGKPASSTHSEIGVKAPDELQGQLDRCVFLRWIVDGVAHRKAELSDADVDDDEMDAEHPVVGSRLMEALSCFLDAGQVHPNHQPGFLTTQTVIGSTERFYLEAQTRFFQWLGVHRIQQSADSAG